MHEQEIPRDTPPEVALQHAYGPHHFVEMAKGLDLAGAPLRPAHILVNFSSTRATGKAGEQKERS